MWDSIASSDIEQAKHSLNLRRAETLSRHAEEITALDTERSEFDQLAAAIDTFMSKFGKGIKSSDAPAVDANEPPPEKPAESDNPEVGRQSAAASFGMNFRNFG